MLLITLKISELITKHRAVFYCRLSLRERTEKRDFRGAKGDTYLPNDAMQSSNHTKLSKKIV